MRKIFLILFFLTTFSFAFEEINASDFEEKTKGQNVIIDFFAHWCPACSQIEEHLDFYSQGKDVKVKIYKINVELNPEFSLEHGAMSLPTLLYIKNGEIVHKQSGFHNYEDIERNVNDYILN